MRRLALATIVVLTIIPAALAQDPWPAEPEASADNLTSIEGPGVNDFHLDLSGACWNPVTRTLWVCRNGPTDATSKLWAVVEDGAGGYEIDERLAQRGEWTGFRDLEGVTQADFAEDVVYLIIEDQERIKEFDVSTYGVAVLNNDWDARLDLPGVDGAEGITFVPDACLTAAGFVDAAGVPFVSQRGMGGVMMVGHQNSGEIFVFDLDRTNSMYDFVGEYRTGYDETAGLEFDRSTGLLYVWHGDVHNVLEVLDLTSTTVMGQPYRQFNAVASYVGPDPFDNYEGIAVVSADDCVDGERSFFMAIDGGSATSLLRFQEFRPGCRCLDGTVNDGSGAAENVLFVNGSAGDANREVFAAVLTPITIALDPSSAGSGAGRYFMWIWNGPSVNTVDLAKGAEVLGCLANPSPLQPALAPQPLRCLRGNGIPAGVCGGVLTLNPPGTNFVPWAVTKASGFATPRTMTLQAVVEDVGATNTVGFSASNAVTLIVQ